METTPTHSYIICPYCGCENGDGYAPLEFEDEIKCTDCDRPFGYTMEILYTTYKIDTEEEGN